MSTTNIFILAISLGLLLFLMSIKTDVQNLKIKVSNDKASIQTLFENLSKLKTQVNQFKFSRSLMNYLNLLQNAPRILPVYPLVTVSSTNLQDFGTILSVSGLYEITKMKKEYFLAYPGIGTTFSIQILSSSATKVTKLVNVLRSESIPAFEIIYGNVAGLFVGVFPNHKLAVSYASDVSKTLYPTVRATMASWIIRTIP